MRALLDVQSAMGGDEEIMLGIARALGQMQAKGKVSSEELMQLAERGIPSYQILREKLGLTAKEVYNIGNMAIKSGPAVQAIFEGMTERFGGNAEKMANTYTGQIQIIKNHLSDLQRMAGDIAMPKIVEQLKEASQYLKENKVDVAEGIGKGIEKTAEAIQAIIENREKVVLAFEIMFGAMAVNKLAKFLTSLEAISLELKKIAALTGAGWLPTLGLAGVGAAVTWGTVETLKNPENGPFGPGTSPYGRIPIPAKKYNSPETRGFGFDITAGTSLPKYEAPVSFFAANHRPGGMDVPQSVIDDIAEAGKPDTSFLGPQEPDIIKALRDAYERQPPVDISGFVGPEMPELMRAALENEKDYTEKHLSLQRELRDSEVTLMTDKYAQARIMETNRFNDEIAGYAGNAEMMELAAQKHWNNMQAIANDNTQQMIQNAANFGVFWGDMMISIYQQSDHTFSSIASSFGKMIQQMAIKAMVSGFFGMLFGGPAGGAAAFKASLGIPGRASGGSVSAGSPYMVGERGPELFVPKQSGKIIPNGAITDNSQITINFSGNATKEGAAELAVQIDRIIRERKSRELERMRRGVA
jgi:tape measure domain-containing protein